MATKASPGFIGEAMVLFYWMAQICKDLVTLIIGDTVTIMDSPSANWRCITQLFERLLILNRTLRTVLDLFGYDHIGLLFVANF